MSVGKNPYFDVALPVVAGAAWGLYLYKNQDHTPYDRPTQRWGWTKLTNKVSDWFTSGISGGFVIILASGYSLWRIHSLHLDTGYPLLNKGVKLISWAAFFYYSRPSNDPGYKAYYAVYKAETKVRNFFGDFDGSLTQIKCVKEIYSQPIIKNFKIAPQDFLLPFLGGIGWGLYRYQKQDSLFDPNQPRSNYAAIRQLDRLKTGRLGKVVATVISGLGLFTIDQLARPFFPKNKWGKISRFAPWIIYALASTPIKNNYVKAISLIIYGIFLTFKYTFRGLQISLANEELKEIFSYKNFKENPVSYVIPVLTGLFYQMIFGENSEIKEDNSLLVDSLTMPYRLAGNKLKTISNLAFVSLCILVAYQLSVQLEEHTQKWKPLSDEGRVDRFLSTWRNTKLSIDDEKALFEILFMILRSNKKLYVAEGEKNILTFKVDKWNLPAIMNRWDVLLRLRLILLNRQESEKMTLKKRKAPEKPVEKFDFSDSHLASILKILLRSFLY